MKILLVNPPNSGRSIPEEKYGIDSIKQIFKGEPLGLEVLAGNLTDQDVFILDLKAEPEAFAKTLQEFGPDLVGFTGVTCEANAVLKLAQETKEYNKDIIVVVGGIHASMDPDYFNVAAVDFVVKGIAKVSFRQLIIAIESDKSIAIPGVAATVPGQPLKMTERSYDFNELVDQVPPAYNLVSSYRDEYKLTSLDINMGFVATAFGCTFRCSFCCIESQTNGKYLTHTVDAVVRDIKLLGDIPVIRLLDANTFGNIQQAEALCTALQDSGIKKQYLADVRSDTVVKHPELMARWKEAGLRAVVIGFEEVTDAGLASMNKANKVAINTESVKILHDIGITIVGDFIVSPEYTDAEFDLLEQYISDNEIDLPMTTILTPLPGTKLYQESQSKIKIHDLDYYTLTNAVLSTKMDEADFYQRYSSLLKIGYKGAKL